MDFYQQKIQVKINDLRIGSIVKYGAIQPHIVTGINHKDNSIKIRPEKYYFSGQANENHVLSTSHNKKEVIVTMDKITAYKLILKELNEYGFIWENPYKVYYLIDNLKFWVVSLSNHSANVIFEGGTTQIMRTVYTLHELQNVFKFASGIDFINIDKF
jgi:hypothetical protein